MAGEDILSTDDLLEAFRKKKAAAATATGAEEEVLASAKTAVSPDSEPSKGPDPLEPRPATPSATAAPPSAPKAQSTPVPANDANIEDDAVSKTAPSPKPPQGGSSMAPESAQPKPVAEASSPRQAAVEAERAPASVAPAQAPQPSPPPAQSPETRAESTDAPESKPAAPAMTAASADGDDLTANPASRKAPQSRPVEDAVVDVPHRPTAPPKGAGTLAPLDPALGLAGRLQKDRLVVRRDASGFRILAFCVGFVGLLILAFDRTFYALEGNIFVGSIRLTWIAAGIAGAGAIAYALLWFLIRRRVVAVKFAPSQAQEWQRTEGRVKALAITRSIAIGLAAGAPLLAAILLLVFPKPSWVSVGYTGLALGVLAAAVAVALHYLHHFAVRDYIQTTVLWILERSGGRVDGAAASDARVPGVLRALDGLLAQLPDSAVASFMTTPESKIYLELMDSLAEE